MNKEVSRRHLELYVNEDGNVCVLSMGREPIVLNGEQVLSPKVLQTGDRIEVLLEGRTREFFFQACVAKGPVCDGSVGSPLAASSIANQRRGDIAPPTAPVAEIDEHPEELEDAVMAPVPEVDEEEAPECEKMEGEDCDAGENSRGEEDVISGAVSQMVQDILVRVIQSAEAATAMLTPVMNAQKRKSVRFLAHTPEGDAKDATMTIRCVPKDGDQMVLVEDNTVAFSEWGFGTMGKEDEGEPVATADTVVSKQAVSNKDENTPASASDTPSQQNQTPGVSNKLNFDSHPAPLHATPGQQFTGVAAPNTTPVTAAKPTSSHKKSKEVDFASLAQKLTEIAEEHDVQFELPKDFMRFTPMSTTKGKRKSIGEAMSSRAKRLSICSSKEDGNVEYDLPKDFMRFTPMSVPAKVMGKRVSSMNESDVEYDLPKDFMRFTPMSVAKKQMSSTDGAVEYDLPKDFMRFTPMSVPSKAAVGDKIKSALKNLEQSMSAVGDIHESADEGIEEIATLRSVGHAVHELADALDRVASVKKSSGGAKTPGVRIAIVERGQTFSTSNPEVKILFEGGVKTNGEENVAMDEDILEQVEEEHGQADAPEAKQHKKDALVGRFKAVLIQAHSYRTQALVLGKHLRKSSMKLTKARALAHTLSAKHKAEKAKRIELQNTLKELIEARETQEMDLHGAEDSCPETAIDDEVAPTQRVIVLGHREVDPSNSRIETSGRVVVVRKEEKGLTAENAGDMTTPKQASTLKTAPRSATKSVIKSVRRISCGHEVQVVMDDIKMPKWIYDKEEEDASDDEHEEMNDAAAEDALKQLEKSLSSPLPTRPSKEDEETSAEDKCHVCGEGDDGDILLLCDSCDNACHLQCCKPALKRVPKGDWFCANCKKTKEVAKNAPAKRKASAPAKSMRDANKQEKENVSAARRPTRSAASKKQKTTEAEETVTKTRTRRTRSTRA